MKRVGIALQYLLFLRPLFDQYSLYYYSVVCSINTNLYFKEPLPVFILISRPIFIRHYGCVQVRRQDIISEHPSADSGKAFAFRKSGEKSKRTLFCNACKYFFTVFSNS